MPHIPDYRIPPPPPRNAQDNLVHKYWQRGIRLGREEGIEQGRKDVEQEYAKKSRRGFLKDVSFNVGLGAGVLGTLYGIGAGFSWIVDRRNKIREDQELYEKRKKEGFYDF